MLEIKTEYWVLDSVNLDATAVRIKNIVYGSEMELGDYWVIGSFQGGTFSVPLPQVINTGTKGRKAVLVWGTVSYSATTEQASFTLDTSISQMSYTMSDDKIILEGTSGPVVVDGPDNITFDATGPAIIWIDGDSEDYEDYDDYEWAGYCEWNTEINYVIERQPRGDLKTYTRTSDCINYTYFSSSKATAGTEQLVDRGVIVFGNSGKRVYFKNLLPSLSLNTWIMGVLNDDGTLITVPLPQNLYYENGGYFIPLGTGESRMNENTYLPDLGTYADCIFVQDADEENYEVTFVIEGNTIKMMNTWADFTAPYPDNFKARGIYAYDNESDFGSLAANIVYTMESDNPEEPTGMTGNPVINGDYINNGKAYSVEITPSEPSVIYYRVKMDNEGYSEWTTYDNALKFNIPGSYVIQAYALADGKQPSEYVYHGFEIKSGTGVSETSAARQQLNSRYFNVMGQEIQQPNGLTIIVTTYSDGTTTAAKVIF